VIDILHAAIVYDETDRLLLEHRGPDSEWGRGRPADLIGAVKGKLNPRATGTLLAPLPTGFGES